MEQARTAPLSSKAQVEALFDSLALEYLRERERQFSFLSQKRIAIEFLGGARGRLLELGCGDRKSTRLNSSHQIISYAVFCLKKKNNSTYAIPSTAHTSPALT